MKKLIMGLVIILSLLMFTGCVSEFSYDSQVKESGLLTYNDVNYEFSVAYPSDFEYEFNNKDVIFGNTNRDLYYITSIILTTKTGGIFNTLQDVQNDYLSQFKDYSVSLEGSAVGKINDFDSMDFDKQESRSAERHDEAIENKWTCIDCHRGVAHHLPAGYDPADDTPSVPE